MSASTSVPPLSTTSTNPPSISSNPAATAAAIVASTAASAATSSSSSAPQTPATQLSQNVHIAISAAATASSIKHAPDINSTRGNAPLAVASSSSATTGADVTGMAEADAATNKRPSSQSLAPLNRVGKNGEPLSEKKLRRLEKNRLSARECRRRKREATEDLQRQINLLEGENLRLRLQLQIGEEAEVSNQEEQQKLTESIDELLRSGASESEIYAKIEEYKEKFADYGRDRRSAIEFHLRNIERLLQPTQTTSVVLTTLHTATSHSNTATATTSKATAENDNTPIFPQQQASPVTVPSPAAPTTETMEPSSMAVAGDVADSGTTAAAPPASSALPPPPNMKLLFQHLVNILEVTPEQAAALKDSRFVAKEMDECLKASLDVLAELRTRLTQCGQDLEQEFNNIRQILTPTQAAKFLVWVANNKACMHMLNELWNKVYPPAHQHQQQLTTMVFGVGSAGSGSGDNVTGSGSGSGDEPETP